MDLGLTQGQLAKRLGCLTDSVGAWERGLSEPHVARWPAIVAVLGIRPSPIGERLPERVRAARQALGLTQEELARRAGVDVRTVRNIERAAYRPRCRSRVRVLRALGLE